MEHLDKFTFLVLTSFCDRLEGVANVVDFSEVRGPSMLCVFEFCFTKSLAYRKWRFSCRRRGGCKQYTLSHAQFFLVRVAQGSSVCIAAFLCASLYKQFSHRSHAMFRKPFDPPFTAPSQSTSTPSSLLIPSNWTPTASPLCGRFAEQSPLTL